MTWRVVCLIWAVGSGCVTSTSTFEERVPAAGTSRVIISSDRGDATYSIGSETEVVVRGTSWGAGSNTEQATRNITGNTWRVETQGTDVVANGASTFARAGVDFRVEGPSLMNVEMDLPNGNADVRDVEGSHRIYASSISTTRLAGEGDLWATAYGADIEIWPYEDARIDIETEGNLILRLPEFGPYDLQVTQDLGELAVVEDVGFDSILVTDGYVEGWRFPGTARIQVYVRGGSFQLLTSR